MVAVGCRFRLEDLTPEGWRDLAILADERNWMRTKADDLRADVRESKRKEDEAMAAVRRAAGIPPPGQSLFPKGGK